MRLREGSALEVFFVFLRLGCISFGGPVAHLGYFQRELVARRGWCDEGGFAELIALAQSLPGPSSSQVCFGMGVQRAGWLGGVAAWTAFTLPSAVLMLGFAFGATILSGEHGQRLIHGLQLVAVAVVAQAVLTMQRSLAPDRGRIAVALGALAVVLFGPPRFATLLAILGGCAAGLVWFRSAETVPAKAAVFRGSKAVAWSCGVVLAALLLGLPVAARTTGRLEVQVLAAFYRTGALVFGGGHVVLPLLEGAVVDTGLVDRATFLAGYGAAQAMPGPLFSFAAYLGASVTGHGHRVLLGLLALLGLSAPGLLAMAAVLPFRELLRGSRTMQGALRGVNAAVVGVLLAALYSPLWTTTVRGPKDLWLVAAGFAGLVVWKLQPWMVVAAIGAVAVTLG